MSILGKGINAIEVESLSFDYENQSENLMKSILLKRIVLGHYQPRKNRIITKDSIQDLVESIKVQGVLQPIIVRKIGSEQYQLIAGERRYHSAVEAGLKVIPCIIKNVSEQDAFAIALIENIQREQLTLFEVSESLLKLKEEHFFSDEQVAKIVGKPRSTIANLIRAASLLSPEGKVLWENGEVDYGHVRAIIILDHKFQNVVLQYVVDKRLSVRATENLIKEKKYYNLLNQPNVNKISESMISKEEIRTISDKFLGIYNKKVKINVSRSGKIKISIEFEDLEKIYDYLKNTK